MNHELNHASYDPSIGHGVIAHRWDAIQGCRLAMYCPACGVLATLREPTVDEAQRYHAMVRTVRRTSPRFDRINDYLMLIHAHCLCGTDCVSGDLREMYKQVYTQMYAEHWNRWARDRWKMNDHV